MPCCPRFGIGVVVLVLAIFATVVLTSVFVRSWEDSSHGDWDEGGGGGGGKGEPNEVGGGGGKRESLIKTGLKRKSRIIDMY